MYDNSSKFYIVDCHYNVDEVIDGYTNLVSFSHNLIRSGVIGNSFKGEHIDRSLTTYYPVAPWPKKPDFIIQDEFFRTVRVEKLLEHKKQMKSEISYHKYNYYYLRDYYFEFRRDPVPFTGTSGWTSYFRSPRTTQERRNNTGCSRLYTRGKRRNLPNTWDDVSRSDIVIKQSWKKRKKKKQWM